MIFFSNLGKAREMTHMDAIKLEEYKALRQEHENNRKFVFERPLIIVLGMVAAFLGVKNGGEKLLIFLPSLFLVILFFNLWFTFNRMKSSARIVTYIHLFHETEQNNHLIGWEKRLQDFRGWIKKDINQGEVNQIKNSVSPSSSMEFYSPIFAFHLICGIVIMLMVFVHCINELQKYQYGITLWLGCHLVILAIFIRFAKLLFNPEDMKKEIEVTRRIWIKVMGNKLHVELS